MTNTFTFRSVPPGKPQSALDTPNKPLPEGCSSDVQAETEDEDLDSKHGVGQTRGSIQD